MILFFRFHNVSLSFASHVIFVSIDHLQPEWMTPVSYFSSFHFLYRYIHVHIHFAHFNMTLSSRMTHAFFWKNIEIHYSFLLAFLKFFIPNAGICNRQSDFLSDWRLQSSSRIFKHLNVRCASFSYIFCFSSIYTLALFTSVFILRRYCYMFSSHISLQVVSIDSSVCFLLLYVYYAIRSTSVQHILSQIHLHPRFSFQYTRFTSTFLLQFISFIWISLIYSQTIMSSLCQGFRPVT